MAKLKALPRSKAKTAWGLVQDVKRVMLEEPKRVWMKDYIVERNPALWPNAPACGTVGCFAGWCSILSGGKRNIFRTYSHALELLGDCDYDTVQTTDDDGYAYKDHVFSAFGPDLEGEPGTATFARSVVRRIERFQRINEKVLKAKKV